MLPSRKCLEKGLYRIDGAARVRVIEGEFYALGRFFRKGEEIVVPKGVTICIDVENRCEIEGMGGSISDAKPEEEVIKEWRRLSDTITSKPRTVLVVGEVDSGKTTFSTFLINTAITKGLKVAFIDADVGQNDVGYPGTIALAKPDRLLSWLRELKPAALYFVGSNTPSGCEDVIISGINSLLSKTRDCDFIVINTDGWITDRRAIMFKAKIVENVKPDVLVIMKGTGAADCLGEMFSSCVEVIKAPTPPGVKYKERDLRKQRREMAYLKLLRESSVKTLKLAQVKLFGVYTFNGKPDPKLKNALTSLLGAEVYVEISGKNVIISTISDEIYRHVFDARLQFTKLLNKNVLVSNLNAIKGLMVGLLNKHLEHVGVGIVEDVSLKDMTIKIRTPFPVENVCIIVLGRLKISENGAEVERRAPPIA